MLPLVPYEHVEDFLLRMHEDSEFCWCCPVLEYVDPESGDSVWVHNEFEN